MSRRRKTQQSKGKRELPPRIQQPQLVPTTDGRHLLSDLLADLAKLDQELSEHQGSILFKVLEAREAGASWHTIGQAVGLTAEGARRRYRVPGSA